MKKQLKVSYAGRYRKGRTLEKMLVNLAKDKGFEAKREPLSGGATEGKPDIWLGLTPGALHAIQVKSQANGWKGIYKSLSEDSLLIIKANRKEALIVLPYKFLLNLLRNYKVGNIEKVE